MSKYATKCYGCGLVYNSFDKYTMCEACGTYNRANSTAEPSNIFIEEKTELIQNESLSKYSNKELLDEIALRLGN